jgi:hypothetical protein
MWLLLVGIAGVPLVAVGQSVRTTTLRGVVVDEAGMPVENSKVTVYHSIGRKIEVNAAKGEFEIEAPAVGIEMMLSARNETGELQGTETFRVREAGPLRVTLRKAREVVVLVTDPSKQPVGGARVGVDAGDGGFLRQGTVAEQLTDDNGRAVLRVPAAATLQSMFAVKRDVGINYSPLSVGPLEPQTIVLGDNSTIQMRAIDDEDKPLAGVSIRPVSLGRATYPLREFEELHRTTDAMGQATLQMLPAATTGRVGFEIEFPGYAVIQALRFDPRAAPKELIARLAPVVTIRGKVTGADGKPPIGPTEVYAGGAGYHPQEPSGTFGLRWQAGATGVGFRATCDASGAFELPVARNHYYALVAWSSRQQASKESMISPFQMRVVGSKSPTEEISFTLGPGTRIHGVATRGANRNPVSFGPSTMMELAWRDAESYAKLPIGQRLPNPESKTVEIAPALMQYAMTNREGGYEFYVPPGKYTLSSKTSGGKPTTIEVTDQAEIKADFDASGANPPVVAAPANRQPQGEIKVIDLAGRVVLQADRERGIGGVNVRRMDMGTPLGVAARAAPQVSRTRTAITSADGTFNMARIEGESLLLCSTADGLLSSIVKIPATETEVTIPLAPSATLRGRLIDGRTKKPLVGQAIDTMVRTSQTSSSTLGPYAITDASGEFFLTGLPTGWPIRVQQRTTPRSVPAGSNPLAAIRWSILQTTTIDKAGVHEAGAVATMESQPLAVEQVIANATRNGSATGLLEGELGRAELLGQRVLVFAAASESQMCRQFFGLWYSLDEQKTEEAGKSGLAELANQFVLLALDTTRTKPRPVAIRTILERSKVEEPRKDDAGLAILRADGEVLATTTGSSLSSDGKLDAEKVVAFLSKHAVPLPDAEKLLDDALAEAKRLSKRVLVFQSVPLSAPSALISLWLESQGELLARDYECVTIAERYAGGTAVIERAGGKVSSKPWIGVLDESGKQLAISRYEPTAADAEDVPMAAGQMEQMLKGTARKLTGEEIQTIVRSLWVP